MKLQIEVIGLYFAILMAMSTSNDNSKAKIENLNEIVKFPVQILLPENVSSEPLDNYIGTVESETNIPVNFNSIGTEI